MKSEDARGTLPAWAAYHEAGHAIVADYFDVLQSVQLTPEPGTAAGTGNNAAAGPVLYAGPLAQARCQRTSETTAFLCAGMDDFEKLMQLVSRHSHVVPPEELLDVYRDVARTILNARWAAVEAVAAALRERGLLLAPEVRSIVREHTSASPDRAFGRRRRY
jgi:hypothetical protein